MGGVSHPVPDSANIKVLTDVVAGSNSADTFFDVATVANYIVPTGFVFHIIAIEFIINGLTTGTVVFHNSTTVNGTTNTNFTLNIPDQAIAAEHAYEVYVGMLNETIAAGFYAVHNGNPNVRNIKMVGYEVIA